MNNRNPVIYILRYALPASFLVMGLSLSPLLQDASPFFLVLLSLLPVLALAGVAFSVSEFLAAERRRLAESGFTEGQALPVGAPPQREAFEQEIRSAVHRGEKDISRYLIGFEAESGEPIWVSNDDLCGHACIIGKNGSGKTRWLEALLLQQMSRTGIRGCTFIDGQRDPNTLAHIVLMALATGRIDDVVVVDPLEPLHSYDPLQTDQSSNVRSNKVVKTTKALSHHFAKRDNEHLSHELFIRLVKALDALGARWTIHDLSDLLMQVDSALPTLQKMLMQVDAHEPLQALEHVLKNICDEEGAIDYPTLRSALAEITLGVERLSSVLSPAANLKTDVDIGEAIRSGKIVYFGLPHVENRAQAHVLEELIREDLMATILELSSSRDAPLDDPHLIILDEIPAEAAVAWSNVLDSARRAKCACIFSASSLTGINEHGLAPSRAFYERIVSHVAIKVMLRIDDLTTTAELIDWFGRMISPNPGNLPATRSPVSQTRLIKGGIHFDSSSQNIITHAHHSVKGDSRNSQNDLLMRKLVGDKGLAWFDAGHGRVVRGRTFWVDVELPDGWDGKDQVTNFEASRVPMLNLGAMFRKQNDEVRTSDNTRRNKLSVLKPKKSIL